MQLTHIILLSFPFLPSHSLSSMLSASLFLSLQITSPTELLKYFPTFPFRPATGVLLLAPILISSPCSILSFFFYLFFWDLNPTIIFRSLPHTVFFSVFSLKSTTTLFTVDCIYLHSWVGLVCKFKYLLNARAVVLSHISSTFHPTLICYGAGTFLFTRSVALSQRPYMI